MADSTTNRPQNQRQQSGQAVARQDRPQQGVQRWEPGRAAYASPFDFLDRMTEEMDRAFDRMFRDFGLPRRAWSRGGMGTASREGIWTPRLESFHKGDRFVVRADLPGLKKEDVQVEMTDDELTIHGERREEHEEEREGFYHSEREYGQFHRTIPLPDGVIAESAQATFRDGVLEISMQAAPSEANRGRRLEIKEGSEGGEKK